MGIQPPGEVMKKLRNVTKWFKFSLIALFAGLGVLTLGILPVFAGAVIVPGLSAGPYRLGDKMPSQSDCGQLLRYGIRLVGDAGAHIQRIEVTSSHYLLQGSWLRVRGEHGRQDVLRFYGNPDAGSTPQKLLYNFKGLEFEIDPRSEVILKIAIYRPKMRIYKVNPDAIKLYRQYLKK